MSDEDENADTIAIARPEEEALRLKTLSEEKYTSGNLKSALKYAKRAHKLHQSLDGLPELLTAFKILRTAATAVFGSSSGTQNSTPDYYKILQVERFSHIDTIKKQYRKLALTLHPDKNPMAASADAFKLVGEAMRVLSDKIRRKEYDMRLRIAMQEIAAEEGGMGAEGDVETFWTACSACRLLHQFERKYLGHNLMCPRCKKSFKAVEVEEERNNGEDVGGAEKDEEVGAGKTRVSARIQERVAKGGHLGIVEKCGLGMKRKISSVAEILERSREKVARKIDGDGGLVKELESKRLEKVEKLEERDMLKKVQKLVNVDRSRDPASRHIDIGIVYQRKLKRVGGEVRDGVKKASKNGGAEMVESERSKRAKAREEETMTLYQMQILAKKKLFQRKLMMKENEVNVEKLREKEKEGDNEKEEESEKENENEEGMEKEKQNENEEMMEKEKENENEDTMEKEKENENEVGMEKVKEKEKQERETEMVKEKEVMNLREQRNRRGVLKDRNVRVTKRTSKNPTRPETERDRSSKKDSLEVLMLEKEHQEKEIEDTREKRERRRVSKYGKLEIVKRKTSKKYVDSEIERLITKKKGNLEIISVEDSDFHDFDKDRRERSFKKGQVWALYDDSDGMPRHYALVDQIVSVNPFEVTLSWLQFLSNGDDELVCWQKMGSHVSCGSFMVSSKVSIKYLNLFSHVVDCERAAREVYRIYPKKGSVWALYSNNPLNAEGRNQSMEGKLCYDIVVSLSSYSDIHGLSIAHLEKVPGFKTVFKRREVGANAVICLGKNEVKLFSHQIPAKKLSGEEASGLPKDCWELDPASLISQVLIGS